MAVRASRRINRKVRRSSVRRAGGIEYAEQTGAGPDEADRSASAGHSGPGGLVSQSALLAFARETYNIRRRRSRFLPADLFGEPTWDILLDLYVATRENRPVPTTSACIGAHVPPTTALRWLRILEARGLVEREEDGRDGRRTFVRLSEHGLAAMEDFLHAALATLDTAVMPIMHYVPPLAAPIMREMSGPIAEAAE
jgi:DNA-binding transcriptional ArsR family regulator